MRVDILVKNPEIIRTILNNEKVFSVNRLHHRSEIGNAAVSKCPIKILAHLGQGKERTKHEGIYSEVKNLNNIHVEFIEKQWEISLMELAHKLRAGESVKCRGRFMTILRESFLMLYKIKPEKVADLDQLSFLLQQYLSNPNGQDYNDALRSIASELTDAVPMHMTSSLTKLEIEDAAINLGFLFFAAIDNTASSLLATAHLQCRGAYDSDLNFKDFSYELAAKICQPSVRIITRFCLEDIEIKGQRLSKGDRTILALIPTDSSLNKHPKADLMFGAGIHTCPGRKLVLLHTRCLVKGLHQLRQEINIESHASSTKNPYLAGLEELTIKRMLS